MSFDITFGSIGDLLAVGQIAFSLAKALSENRGSAKDYQDLVTQLKLFDKILFQVTLVVQIYKASPELDALCAVTAEVVLDCQAAFNEFRDKFDRKYGSTLGADGAAGRFKTAGKKIMWLKEKEDIFQLKSRLQTSCGSISVLLSTAIGRSKVLDDKAQRLKLQQIHALLRDSLRKSQNYRIDLRTMNQKLDRLSTSSSQTLGSISSGYSTTLNQVNTNITEMKEIFEKSYESMTLHKSSPTGFAATWQQEPVILEDVLGRIVPLPLELVDSWDMLDAILFKRFETQKYPGLAKILKGEYAIEDDLSGKEIPRNNGISWSTVFRPGQKVNMSMTFNLIAIETTSCPKCKTILNVPPNTRVQCTNSSCKMLFRRILQLDEPENTDTPRIDSMLAAEQYRSYNRSGAIDCFREASPGDFHRIVYSSWGLYVLYKLFGNEVLIL